MTLLTILKEIAPGMHDVVQKDIAFADKRMEEIFKKFYKKKNFDFLSEEDTVYLFSNFIVPVAYGDIQVDISIKIYCEIALNKLSNEDLQSILNYDF